MLILIRGLWKKKNRLSDASSLARFCGYAHANSQAYQGSPCPTIGNYFTFTWFLIDRRNADHGGARGGRAICHVTPVEHVYPLVRSQKQLDRVLDEIEEAPGSCSSPC